MSCFTGSGSTENIISMLLKSGDFAEHVTEISWMLKRGVPMKKFTKKEIFSIPNIMGYFRILLIPVFCYLYITAESENIDYSINICEYNDLIKVQVILINNDVSKSEEELKKLSQKIRNDNFINERYFSFIKGKLNTQDKNLIDDLEKNLNIKVNEYLDINNGCVAEATFEDNQHINIGQIKYDTGSYLIIGTPIIFVTY